MSHTVSPALSSCSPRVAVILPTFKPGDYLARCLESLEAQTLPKEMFRVYIGLNGPRSPFETEIFRCLSKTSLRYDVLYLEDAGVSRCRNALLERSTEEFVVFVDDDDVVSPNYLQGLLAVSDEMHIGISDVRSFVSDVSRAGPHYVGMSFATLSSTEYSHVKARKYLSLSVGKMIHRKIIGTRRFDVRLAKGEDSLFMVQLSDSMRGMRKASADTYYLVCVREGSATRRSTPLAEELRGLAYVLRAYLRLLIFPRYDPLLVANRVAVMCVKIFRALWKGLWRGGYLNRKNDESGETGERSTPLER